MQHTIQKLGFDGTIDQHGTPLLEFLCFTINIIAKFYGKPKIFLIFLKRAMDLLNGPAQWVCSMDLLNGSAQRACSTSLLNGPAQWTCSTEVFQCGVIKPDCRNAPISTELREKIKKPHMFDPFVRTAGEIIHAHYHFPVIVPYREQVSEFPCHGGFV